MNNTLPPSREGEHTAHELRVTIRDGKYTVVLPVDGKLHALRYGQPWRDCVGDGLILSFAQEVERLRDALKLAETIIDAHESYSMPKWIRSMRAEIKVALASPDAQGKI